MFKSALRMQLETRAEEDKAREHAFFLIESTQLDIDDCRELFEEEFPGMIDVFEQCVDEAS